MTPTKRLSKKKFPMTTTMMKKTAARGLYMLSAGTTSSPCVATAICKMSLQLTAVEVMNRVYIALRISSKFKKCLVHSPPEFVQSHFVWM
jgi:hypothetical protein